MDTKNGWTRRGLAQAAALVPFSAVSGTAANSAFKVGLIGSGGRGTYVSGILAKDPRARIVALCDIFDDRIEKAKSALGAGTAKTYKDFRDLLASDVDAVIIATPVYLHPEHFEAAVQAGKHIYIEKPAAVDIAGCRRIMRAADSANTRFNITFGFQRRYGQVFRKAKAALDAGAIGEIRMAHAHWLKGLPQVVTQGPIPRPTDEESRVKSWMWWRDTFGDAIVETFCHGVDVLNWFLGGHPEKAYGTGGRTLIRAGDIMDHVDVTFTYARNVQACLTGSYITPPFYRSVHEQFFGASGVIETSETHWSHYKSREEVVTEKSPRNIAIDSVEAFIDRVSTGKPENTGVRGAETTLTAIMGRMAIDLKREVTWNEVMGG